MAVNTSRICPRVALCPPAAPLGSCCGAVSHHQRPPSLLWGDYDEKVAGNLTEWNVFLHNAHHTHFSPCNTGQLFGLVVQWQLLVLLLLNKPLFDSVSLEICEKEKLLYFQSFNVMVNCWLIPGNGVFSSSNAIILGFTLRFGCTIKL